MTKAEKARLAALEQQLEEARKQLAESKREIDLAHGRRADTLARVEGFTITETRILRCLASGFVAYDKFTCLQRHMSNIRAKLPKGVVVKTELMEGYSLAAGAAILKALLKGSTPGGDAAQPIQPRPTPTERVAAQRANAKEMVR